MPEDEQRATEAAKTRIDLLDRTLSYCTEDYDFVSATYAGLDSKAQATFGVAGVFVTGSVVLFSSMSEATDVPWWIPVLVVLTYGLLLLSIVASLVALRVREVAAPLDSAAVMSMTLDVIKLPDEELSPEVRANWYRDQLDEWRRAISDVEETNTRKGRWLTSAQTMLIVAIGCAGVVTVGLNLQ